VCASLVGWFFQSMAVCVASRVVGGGSHNLSVCVCGSVSPERFVGCGVLRLRRSLCRFSWILEAGCCGCGYWCFC